MLKKGSKGKPVEELQTLVNKLGIKPALDVDGIFGPLTDKAVRESQRKLKVANVDGKADALTPAALKFGKPLPKMEIPDVKKQLLTYEAAFRHLEKIELQIGKFKENSKTVGKAIQKLENDLTVAAKMDLPTWTRVIDGMRKIFDAQQKFDQVLLKNPAQAAKLAREAASKYDMVEDSSKSLLSSATAVGDIAATERKNLTTGVKALEGSLLEIEKRYADTVKKVK